MSDRRICALCDEPMPEGEEMFKFHGYSGPCPRGLRELAEEKAATSTEIKELVKRLQYKAHCCCGPHIVGKCSPCRAADALEAMAGEVELVRAERHRAQTACEQIAVRLHATEAERDRLKVEHDRHLADAIDAQANVKVLTAERDRLRVALMDIKHYGAGYAQDRARKALGDAS